MRTTVVWYSFVLILSAVFTEAHAADEFDVLPQEFADGPKTQMLHRYLATQSTAALDRRTVEYEKIKTADDARAYQQRMKSFFVEQLGGFPERTPLNAQTIARRESDGYLFEKVVFESRPNFHVTALLFLPPGKGPFPGVLVPCGHSANGKAEKKYQQACILMAKNGMAALCYDPLGQGERHQVLLPDGKTSPPNHTVLGVSCIPLGTNFAQFRIWDGMRALDYLAERPEVDPKRLGCTGNSGGGTLTSYLMALDERIGCAAPSCYITSHRRLLEKAGPQDAEQNIFNQIGFGMTMAEYVMMRAPRPTLICTATRDMFDIRGSWDTYRESKRFYARFGVPEHVDLVETDEGHGFHTQLREGSARWMQRWLAEIDAPPAGNPLSGKPIVDEDPPVIADPDALATPTGQVLRLAGERTVFDINADADDALIAARNKAWEPAGVEATLGEVRRLADIRPLGDLPNVKVEQLGAIARPNYELRKVSLTWEAGISLPALVMVPKNPAGDALLYVDGAGKSGAAAEGGELDRLADAGTLVVAVDLRGLGELAGPAPARPSPLPAAWKEYFAAYLLGRSHVGMWAEDVLAVARWMNTIPTPQNRPQVRVVGVGLAGPAVLHAAALESPLFHKVELRQSLADWSRVVRDRAGCGPQLMNLVHGALRVYDLPDLARHLGPKLTIIGNGSLSI